MCSEPAIGADGPTALDSKYRDRILSNEFRLEGLVSKHRDRAYRAGTSPNWVKVKNPKHPRAVSCSHYP
jgi:ATP-dependent DNA ligase